MFLGDDDGHRQRMLSREPEGSLEFIDPLG